MPRLALCVLVGAILLHPSNGRTAAGPQQPGEAGAMAAGAAVLHPVMGDSAYVAAASPLPQLTASNISRLQGIGTSAASATLTINVLLDSSITSDPNTAAIQAAISSAVADYARITDPITVTILFREMSSGLGQSNWYYYTGAYSTFISLLRSDAQTADDAAAIALLPAASANPVTGSSSISVKPANLRAVGFNQAPPSDCVQTGLAVACDGIVSFNTHITTPGSPGSSGQYSLKATIQHEIDEVLGLGSGLSGSTIMPEDLFRYNQSGNRTFTAIDSRSSGVYAYFSLDRFTQLAEFDNQSDGGDFGDWQSNPRRAGVAARVQDAYATAGQSPAMAVEWRALDVVGYNDCTPTAPSITSQPNSPAIAYNTSATLSVTTSGCAINYQWYLGASPNTASPIAGATSSSYTTSTLISDKKYWVHVSNSQGAADSSTALVTVNFTDPTLSTGSTLIKKQHWDEVAARINAEEARAGRATTTFRTLTAGTSAILLQDYTDRRTAVTALFNALGLTPVWHSNPAVGSVIGFVELNDLRANLRTLEDR